MLWIGIGVFMRRRSDAIRHRISHLSRLKRTLIASVGLIASLAALLAGLFLIDATGQVGKTGLTPIGLVAVILLGSGFVIVQVLATACMIANIREEVTMHPGSTSIAKVEENS